MGEVRRLLALDAPSVEALLTGYTARAVHEVSRVDRHGRRELINQCDTPPLCERGIASGEEEGEEEGHHHRPPPLWPATSPVPSIEATMPPPHYSTCRL